MIGQLSPVHIMVAWQLSSNQYHSASIITDFLKSTSTPIDIVKEVDHEINNVLIKASLGHVKGN